MFTEQDCKRASIRAKRINFLIAGLAVIAGGMIYILCRTPDYSFFQWIRSMGFDGALAFLRAHSLPNGSKLPDWIVYSLPDGLWAFAYTLIILTIWYKSHSFLMYFWYATIPTLTIGSEILPWMGIIPGTFCLSDVVLILCGLFAGILAANLTLKQSTHENTQAIRNTG